MAIKEQQEHVERRKELSAAYKKAAKKYNILNTAKQGELCIESGYGTTTELDKHIDIGTKSRAYTLHLDGGPYKTKYTQSGGSVLYIGQNRAAMVNTVTLESMCDREIDDRVWDGVFLHRDTFWALAQSKCVYVYDQNGVEVHALREHSNVRGLTYLQDHFLLGTLTHKGVLRYQDTTIGKLVSEIDTKSRGSPIVHDRTNGVVYLAGKECGSITLWSPRTTEYLAKVSASKAQVRHIRVSECGRVLVTASKNEVCTWDIRNMYKATGRKTYAHKISAVDISQKNIIAIGQKNTVEIVRMKDSANSAMQTVLSHYTGKKRVSSLAFMPYEDILTVGTEHGIENIVVPGSALETYRRNENPRASKKEKKEYRSKKNARQAAR